MKVVFPVTIKTHGSGPPSLTKEVKELCTRNRYRKKQRTSWIIEPPIRYISFILHPPHTVLSHCLGPHMAQKWRAARWKSFPHNSVAEIWMSIADWILDGRYSIHALNKPLNSEHILFSWHTSIAMKPLKVRLKRASVRYKSFHLWTTQYNSIRSVPRHPARLLIRQQCENYHIYYCRLCSVCVCVCCGLLNCKCAHETKLIEYYISHEIHDQCYCC